MKELVEDLKIANDNLYSTNQMLEQEIQRLQKLLDIEKNKRKLFDKDNQKLHSIIKEVREYIENKEFINYKKNLGNFERMLKHRQDISKILDKGE